MIWGDVNQIYFSNHLYQKRLKTSGGGREHKKNDKD